MSLTSKPMNLVIAVLVVAVAGTAAVGYSIESGTIYLGPKIPDFKVTGNGTTDVGIPVNLGIKLNSSPASKLYYVWYSNGVSGYDSQYTTSFNTPGVYNISLKVSMSNNHTHVTRIIREVVNPLPTISISENKNIIDYGQSISFTSRVSGGTGTYHYSWNDFSSSSADPTESLYILLVPVTATVTDSVGGSATSNGLNPTINSDPLVTATSNVSYTDVGSKVTFSAEPSWGTSPYSYKWTWDGQVISTSQSFSYSFYQSGEQEVYCNMTDKMGVSSTDYVVVSVAKDPTMSLSISPSSPQTGYEVEILANENYGTDFPTYQWFLNGVSANSYASYSALYYTFNTAGTYTVKAIATDSVGMSVTASITFYVS